MPSTSIDKSQALSLIRTNKVVTLFSDGLTGHRIGWLHILLEKCKLDGKTLLLVCQDSSRLQDSTAVKLFDFFLCDQVSEGSYWIESFILDIDNRIEGELLLWDGDNHLLLLLKTKLKFRVLIMRPYATMGAKSCLSYISKIIVLYILKYSKKHQFGLLKIPLHHPRILKKQWVDDELPSDIVEFSDGAEMIDFKSGSNAVILVPGYISSRKNPIYLVNEMRKIQEKSPKELILRFTGLIAENLVQEFEISSYHWLEVRNEFLSREDYIQEIKSADLVILPYMNLGSSGVLIESLFLGKTVALLARRRFKTLENFASGKVILFKKDGLREVFANYERQPFEFETSLKVVGLQHVSALEFLLTGSLELAARE